MKHKVFVGLIFLYLMPWIFSSCDAVLLPQVLEPPEFDPLLNIQVFYLRGTNSEMIGRFSIVHSSYEPYNVNEMNSNEFFDPQIQAWINRNGFNSLSLSPVAIQSSFSHTLRIDPEIEIGEKIVMEVNHPEYGTFHAEQTMPTEVILDRIQNLGSYGINDVRGNLGEPTYGVRISLQDPPERNYYQISLIQDTTIINDDTTRQLFNYFSIIRNQLFQTLFNESFFFNDEEFNGQKFDFVMEKLNPLNQSYKVVFRNLTKEWYEYELSLIEQNKPYFEQRVSTTLLPGYVQPSQIRGNFEGALGCFGLGSERWYDME